MSVMASSELGLEGDEESKLGLSDRKGSPGAEKTMLSLDFQALEEVVHQTESCLPAQTQRIGC